MLECNYRVLFLLRNLVVVLFSLMFLQPQKFKRKNSEIVSVIFVAKNLALHLDFYVKAQCVRLWLLSSIFHLAEE